MGVQPGRATDGSPGKRRVRECFGGYSRPIPREGETFYRDKNAIKGEKNTLLLRKRKEKSIVIENQEGKKGVDRR